MKLENQVVSLDLAKRLKELGVKQESIFYWKMTLNDAGGNWRLTRGGGAKWNNGARIKSMCSAFTVAELDHLLPWRSKRMGTVNNAELINIKLKNMEGDLYRTVYWDEDFHLYSHGGIVADSGFEKKPADARAKMLIYLIENNLITPSKDNV